MNTHNTVKDFTNNRPENRFDPLQILENDKKTTHHSDLWTLDNARPTEIAGLDWYEKSKLIVHKNQEYLQNSIGRGNGTNSSITLVSGLFDLGRGDLKNDFTRSFDFYVKRFSVFLKYKFPKIIFIQPEHYHLYQPYIEENEYPTFIINKTLDEIRAFPYYADIDKIRTDPNWYNQEQWLSNSPQATLPLYNAMVMSKILWTRDAAQINPFNTDSFLWIDGGHQCNDPAGIVDSTADIFREHFDKLLITYFDYEPNEEIHGFKRKPFFDYIDYRARHVLVGRGGIFGGTKEFLEVSSEVYMLALEDSLKAGFMGTEENIFSILFYRFPELVHEFLNGNGGNCAIFYSAVHGPQPLPPPPPVYTVVEDGIDLRGAKCQKLSEGQFRCTANGVACPSYVTPMWLESAEGQQSCQVDRDTRYCTVDCRGDDVFWFAHNCSPYDTCPPHGTIHWSEFYNENPFAPPEISPPPPLLADDGLDLRDAHCTKVGSKIQCSTGGVLCPPDVTPLYLHAAEGQLACILEGYFCTVKCRGETNEMVWYAHPCPAEGICPPHGLVPWTEFYSSNPFEGPAEYASTNYNYEVILPPPLPPVRTFDELRFNDFEIAFMNAIKASYDEETRTYIQRNGYDLRGLQCEIKDGKEVCFAPHRGGRDLCPEWVDSAYLTLAPGQYSCTEADPSTYCTAMCQEGVDRVSWRANNFEWCSGTDSCDEIPPVIPYDEFYLKAWSMEPIPVKPCETMSSASLNALKKSITPFTIGILSRGTELETLQISMETWIADGLLQFASEVLIMVNEMTPTMEEYLSHFTQDPIHLEIIASDENEGILRGINWLMGNSSNEYFLFLEKDFRLVEPLPCALEQIDAGIQLINNDVANVVKYRSRFNAGRPNWAEISYKGREEAIFDIQPNLLCNFYHWVDYPAQRWPNHFDVCHENPLFYCVDSEFCNWTNNPFLVNKHWWFENFVDKFTEIRQANPDFNLEGFMNWHKEIWNDRGWIVAEGDGMFKHCDANNFGQ